jgi:hypothetical protein
MRRVLLVGVLLSAVPWTGVTASQAFFQAVQRQPVDVRAPPAAG